MLRWLFYLVLAIWAARLSRLLQSRPARRPAKDFHPDGGASRPAGAAAGKETPFAPGEVVDAEFEDVTAPRQP